MHTVTAAVVVATAVLTDYTNEALRVGYIMT